MDDVDRFDRKEIRFYKHGGLSNVFICWSKALGVNKYWIFCNYLQSWLSVLLLEKLHLLCS